MSYERRAVFETVLMVSLEEAVVTVGLNVTVAREG